MGNVILSTVGACKYFGGLHAVEDISFELHQGEIVGLIGPNGAGKTTFFNMLSGVLPMTKGELYVEGQKVNKIKSCEMAKMGIGRTYQIVQPFMNLTVLENTMVGSYLHCSKTSTAKEKAYEILEIVDLQAKANVRGEDLNLLDLKRMEVARALATTPKVLLLDEVMAGLNPAGHNQMIEIVKKLRDEGISIIIIEHNMKAIMALSDRIYVFNNGKMLAEGLPEDVANNPLVIKAYLGGEDDDSITD